MLASTGFHPDRTGTVNVINEWPDLETAVRALAAAGPSIPAIEAVGYEAFCDALSEVIEPIVRSGSGDPRLIRVRMDHR